MPSEKHKGTGNGIPPCFRGAPGSREGFSLLYGSRRDAPAGERLQNGWIKIKSEAGKEEAHEAGNEGENV